MVGGFSQGAVYQLLSKEEKLKKGTTQDPVVAQVDALLHEAITMHASDIHLQPTEHELVVRYRIDGVLYDQHKIDMAQAPLIVSRLKVLANLDIAQRRIPQDGRFKAVVDDANGKQASHLIDFRISTFPTLHGEKMVIRILDRSLRLLAIDSLGLDHDMHTQLKSMCQRPFGLFLVTGPTGCGKTTMLYALISALDVQSKNIVTIEDPIEYELAGITQSQVNNKAGFTFDNGLRAMLRQDPDVIMVGEIRDKQTAHIAIESALTGHLVLSTLHTNDAASAIARLLEMGIEPFLISATLTGVLAQRLARRLCTSCKKKIALDVTKVPQGILSSDVGSIEAYSPGKCSRCHNLGYQGRTGIFELLMVNDPIRELIMRKADATQLRQRALAQGMRTLMRDGFEKVKAGMTSLDEILPFMMDM